MLKWKFTRFFVGLGKKNLRGSVSAATASYLEGGRRKWRRMLKINNSAGGYERSNTRLNERAG